MDHRGRSRRDDDYYEDTYRPRHRSLGRQAIDKLEDAMDSLKLDHRGTNALEEIPYHAGREVRRSSSQRRRSPSHHHHSSQRRRSHSHHHHSSYHRHHSSHHHRPRSPSHHDHRHHDHHHTSRRYHSSSPTRHHSTRHHHTTHHSRSPSRSRSRPLTHGLQASVEAAAIEAYRLRNEPLCCMESD